MSWLVDVTRGYDSATTEREEEVGSRFVLASAVGGRPLVMRNRRVVLVGIEPWWQRSATVIVTASRLLCNRRGRCKTQQGEERMRAECHHERFQYLRSEFEVESELPI